MPISMNSSLKRRARLCGVILFLLLLAAGAASLCLGASGLSPRELWQAVREGADSPAARILLYIRLPRTLAALLSGAALAETCAQVLRDAGVYKQDENGRAGVIRFLSTLGYAVR